MKKLADTALSVLDLVPVNTGETPADALRKSLDLARQAEALGFQRYWVAEHHNMPGVASSATSVVIGHLAAGTRRIRVGAGGVMLPNHAPLIIAEQFGTLASLYPDRIDLGLGRAPGTDPMTARALRRDLVGNAEDFPALVAELRGYFEPEDDQLRPRAVRAVPGAGVNVPIWLLGSSDYSARLAAELGLPFAFASQFAPQHLLPALSLYRDRFQPSAVLDKPYAMAGVNVYLADTDAEAQKLASSHKQQFLNLIRGVRKPLPAPVDSMDGLWSAAERAMVETQLAASFTGSPARVREGLESFLERTAVDELIVNSAIFDHGARLLSYRLLAELRGN
ncbi:LLM class flavin-dependent oxidoreductase [Mangrovitalea sediminis]|uniref:LLM class flavin-dependent oxidoreductase n=1 Tax=Mangrovitalea sediminis TaxID=1982043 RepID=UPI001D0D0D2A|nr:LLM class flavin-dependent oxidoreductase [Mangrovitalea sediminis]